MIEVFKTNVKDRYAADMLIGNIQKTFHGYQANFDLDDCDKILRVSFDAGIVQSALIISLLKHFKYRAEILEEQIVPFMPVFENR